MKIYKVYLLKARNSEEIVYVGLTQQTLYKRFNQHVSHRKFSPKDYFIEMVEEELTLQQAIVLEELLIEQYQTRVTGWNKSPKSINGYSNAHSEEQKAKWRETRKGTRPTPEHLKKLNRTGLKNSAYHNQKISEASSKPVICLNNGKVYSSARKAAKELNLSYSKISLVCNGKRPHTKGYKFKFSPINSL